MHVMCNFITCCRTHIPIIMLITVSFIICLGILLIIHREICSQFPIFFDRIVKLLVTCPHFRCLDIYIDTVDGFEIFSAPYIFGIRPQDWDKIKRETRLFDNKGISPTHWEKIVNSTSTNSTETFTITIETRSIKRDGKSIPLI